jgi:hypothetical protein
MKTGGLDVEPPQRAVVPTPTPMPDALLQLDNPSAPAISKTKTTLKTREM